MVEKYFQEIEHCFTMTNIQCKRRKEIDLLAINPVNGQKFHVEVRVATSRSHALTYDDTSTSKGILNKRSLDYFAKQKFNHPMVVEKIKELFGDTNYDKILVIWAVKHTDAMGEIFGSNAYHEYGIQVYYIMDMINSLKKNGTMRGSRDPVLRLIELIALSERLDKECIEKAINRIKRTKIVEV